MSVSLSKGQGVSLQKRDGSQLSLVRMGLGWDPVKKRGFFGSREREVDLDASAVLFADNQPVDVAFFNHLRSNDGSVTHTGDNRTGAGEGDDEQIVVRLNSLPPQYHKILFVVSIYQGQQKGQHFGMIENAFIRAVDARGREMARFNVSGDAAFNQKRSVVFAEVYRRDGGWKFRAIGTPYDTDSFVDILRSYVR